MGFEGATIKPRCIVMEFVENGNLQDVIRKRTDVVTESRSFTIMKEVAAVMVRTHECGVSFPQFCSHILL
jgi:serine/threonine protein kinase